ncbi:MAG: hypothetical protein QF805_29095, partial [Pirellulaceae bacterium]|nr:hypothetical protein [Pirellulaceae bacterium]
MKNLSRVLILSAFLALFAMPAVGQTAPPDNAAVSWTFVLAKLDSHYPAEDSRDNRELAQLLTYLSAPNVVERT